MPFIEGLGQGLATQAVTGAVSEGMGLLFQGAKNKQEAKQYRKLQNISLEAEQTRLDRNQAAALKMWEDTSYPAQMEQMKKAGINPGLMYGMGGGGGVTSSVSPGSPTGGAGTGKAQPTQGMGMLAGQMALLEAQRKNVEADTANKLAENPNIPKEGVKKDLEIEGFKLNNEYLKGTMSSRINKIEAEAEKEIIRVQSEKTQLGVDNATVDAKIDKIRAEAVGEILKNGLIAAQKGNTEQSTKESVARIQQMDAQIKKWAADIAQGWTNLNRQEKELRLKELETNFRTTHPTVGQVMGGTWESIKEWLTNPNVSLTPIDDTIKKALENK